jgi:RNA polymerase sigma factor (sigma-70 family)
MKYSFTSFLANTLEYKELPKKLEENRLTELVKELRAGNAEPSHEIIMGHIRLAMALVSKKANKRQADDLVGEALLRLVDIVDKCRGPNSRLNVDVITPFIAQHIRYALRKYITRDFVMYIPDRTLRLKAAKGQIVLLPHMASGFFIKEDEESPKLSLFMMPVAKQEEPSAEFKEILNLAICSEQERRVITLRANNYSHTEIAPILGLSIRRIGQINEDVEKRFDQLYG